MEKILIVEDDADINNLLAKIMKKQGYDVVQAFSGTEAALRLQGEDYSLILLDLMLPGMMGEEVLLKIRETSEVPLIVISAKPALEDRVELLNLGADDYLVKPFERDEVVARAGRAIRRYHGYHQAAQSGTKQIESDGKQKLQYDVDVMEGVKQKEVLKYKQLTLYIVEREAVLSGERLNLTGHEFDILCLFMRSPNKVFSRESLYDEIWQGGYYGEDNTVNMHISNLRKKIAAVTDDEYIKTVWGIGYKLV